MACDAMMPPIDRPWLNSVGTILTAFCSVVLLFGFTSMLGSTREKEGRFAVR